MIILIAGATHTGKTLLAQRLLEAYHWPYLSIDHLKMGLIRSGQTALTPMDDDIENGQNLIVEGCYIPAHWRKDFAPAYLSHIRDCWLIMSRSYIESRFRDILAHGNAIEHRLDNSLDKEALIRENEQNLRLCQEYGCNYLLLEDAYEIRPEDVLH